MSEATFYCPSLTSWNVSGDLCLCSMKCCDSTSECGTHYFTFFLVNHCPPNIARCVEYSHLLSKVEVIQTKGKSYVYSRVKRINLEPQQLKRVYLQIYLRFLYIFDVEIKQTNGYKYLKVSYTINPLALELDI